MQSLSSVPEKVVGGFAFTEGPVFSRRGYLLFSDIPPNRIMKWERGKVTVFRENSNGANGLTFDHQGRLLACETGRVTRTEKDGKITTLAQKGLSNPRALVGDNLAKSNKKASVDGIEDRRVLRGGTNVIELHYVRGLEHSGGMLVAYLPNQKTLFSADFNVPAPNAAPGPVNPSFVTLQQNIDRLKLDYDSFITVHAPNPDRPLTRADVQAVLRGGTN